MRTAPTDYLDKLKAHGLQLAVGTTKAPPIGLDQIPAGSVWIADTRLDSIGYVGADAVADLIIMLWEQHIEPGSAADDHVRGALGL